MSIFERALSPDRSKLRAPSVERTLLLFRLWNPLLRFSMPRFPLIGATPLCRIAFDTCACSRAKECAFAVVVPCVVPCEEKKCWLPPRFASVEAAAGRPLALRLDRVGVTGMLPVAKRAFCIAPWLTG